MAVAIMVLELFVAFLQAYIFALLASVFIGHDSRAPLTVRIHGAASA